MDGKSLQRRVSNHRFLSSLSENSRVRCDMAMLLLPDIFQGTWGVTPEPFWPKAIWDYDRGGVASR
jgi:hypothetical protein